MPACSICYERFTAPVSLPCGHVFCRECLRLTVDSIKSCNVQHWCPTCRVPYSVVTLDPALIPPYLRPHILPAIRPIFIDDSPTASSPSTSASPSTSVSTSESTPPPAPLSKAAPAPEAASPPPPSDLGRAIAELTAMRMSCGTWRRRAEVHAAANAGLLGFARAAKDAAVRLRVERDAARTRCELLKRKLAEATSPSDSGFESEPERHARGLPAFLRHQHQHQQHAARKDDAAEPSCFGPPLKRRRSSLCTSDEEAHEPGEKISVQEIHEGTLAGLPVSDVRSLRTHMLLSQ
ncbi:hypothetical protein DFH07DRAFT_931523 [Mycena maculata]|uniref:RING-type domain-containing protein n=1 Tax=Mycena maculata TaxID=230809 RepID=A0AAD7HQY2_9AGAR|nr:hypothetical protein DFH07DRAFT_931523 [Mycena maculata]